MIDTKTLRTAIEVGDFPEEIMDLLLMCADEIESLQLQLADPSGRVTLLDDFAMSAQQGLIVNESYRVTPEFIARKAYAQAQAMLTERARIAAAPSRDPSLVLQAVEIPPANPAPQEPSVAAARTALIDWWAQRDAAQQLTPEEQLEVERLGMAITAAESRGQ